MGGAIPPLALDCQVFKLVLLNRSNNNALLFKWLRLQSRYNNRIFGMTFVTG